MNQRLVALELAQLRAAAGRDRREVAAALGRVVSQIGHLETARRRPTYEDLRALTDLYGRPDRLEVLWLRTTLGHTRGWWDRQDGPNLHGPESFASFVGLEQGAARLRVWEPLAVTGLLQTPEYARAIITADDPTLTAEEITTRAAIRARRQGVVGRVDLHVILTEAALRLAVGGPAVMEGQLNHLVAATRDPHTRIQVLEAAGGAHPGLHGPFTAMSFPTDPEVEDPGVVYVEHRVQGRYYEEPADIAVYTGTFDHLARLAGDPDETPAILARYRKEITP